VGLEWTGFQPIHKRARANQPLVYIKPGIEVTPSPETLALLPPPPPNPSAPVRNSHPLDSSPSRRFISHPLASSLNRSPFLLWLAGAAAEGIGDGQVEEPHGAQPVVQGAQERHQEAQAPAPGFHQGGTFILLYARQSPRSRANRYSVVPYFLAQICCFCHGQLFAVQTSIWFS
jgi:hypothetical protein